MTNTIRLVGFNRFIMAVRVNSLMEYSANHYEILDPLVVGIDSTISRVLGTLALPNRETISDYDYYVLNKELQMIKVSPLFVPENKQYLILLSKLIKYPPNCFNVVNKRVIDYLENGTKRFLERVRKSAYQNIEYENYLYDPLP